MFQKHAEALVSRMARKCSRPGLLETCSRWSMLHSKCYVFWSRFLGQIASVAATDGLVAVLYAPHRAYAAAELGNRCRLGLLPAPHRKRWTKHARRLRSVGPAKSVFRAVYRRKGRSGWPLEVSVLETVALPRRRSQCTAVNVQPLTFAKRRYSPAHFPPRPSAHTAGAATCCHTWTAGRALAGITPREALRRVLRRLTLWR